MKSRQENKNNSQESPRANNLTPKQKHDQKLDIQRSKKMKYYLDSVAQHRIDETNSEQNSSFISLEATRRQSLKGPALLAQRTGEQKPTLDHVTEQLEDDSIRITSPSNLQEL